MSPPGPAPVAPDAPVDLAGPRSTGRGAVWSWYLFDWATQPFFTLIVTFLYGPYFATSIAANEVDGQALWGYAAAAAGVLVALLAPFFGAVADRSGRRKPWIFAFSVLLCVGCYGLWFGTPGAGDAVLLVLASYVIATVGAEFATVFTNAMMPDLVPGSRLGRLSGTGAAVGYVGGLVSLILVLALIDADPATGLTRFGVPPLFGLIPAAGSTAAIGPFSALWYAVFALPLFLLIPDRPTREPVGAALREGVGALVGTLKDAIRRRPLILYLIANVFIRDGIAALGAFGGIYAAGVLGWGQSELGVFGIVLIVTAAFGAWAGGRLDDRVGPLAVIVAALAGLIVCALTILSLDHDRVLFVVPVAPPAAGASLFTSLPSQLMLLVGALLGLFFGPILAAGRSLLVALSPPDRITAVFGLYAFTGKVTSFLAPLSVAILTDAFDSQRWGAAVIPLFLVAGLVLMRWVHRAAIAERSAAVAPRQTATLAAKSAGGSV